MPLFPPQPHENKKAFTLEMASQPRERETVYVFKLKSNPDGGKGCQSISLNPY